MYRPHARPDFPQEIAEAATEAPLSAAAKLSVDAASRGSALLFVHGAAIKFEQAVRRTSQMKASCLMRRGHGQDQVASAYVQSVFTISGPQRSWRFDAT